MRNPPCPNAHEAKGCIVSGTFREQNREYRKQQYKPNHEVEDEEEFPECTREETGVVPKHGAKVTNQSQ